MSADRILAFCREFSAAYRAAGSPGGVDDFGDAAPSWPLETPEWAQRTVLSIEQYPEIAIVHERTFSGEAVTLSIVQTYFVHVETAGECPAGHVSREDVPTVFIDSDGHGADADLSPGQAIELSKLLSRAASHLEKAVNR